MSENYKLTKGDIIPIFGIYNYTSRTADIHRKFKYTSKKERFQDNLNFYGLMAWNIISAAAIFSGSVLAGYKGLELILNRSLN